MVAVLLFGYAAVTALADAVRAPSVPSVVLFVILLTFFAMAVVLALEAVASGLLRLAPDGYRTLFGRRRRWSDVLALGTGRVDGRDAAVVAVRPDDGDLVDQDAFTGFAEDETALVVAALRERVPVTPGSASWWSGPNTGGKSRRRPTAPPPSPRRSRAGRRWRATGWPTGSRGS